MAHEAVTSLRHSSFRVLVMLAAEYTGYNNGALGLTRKQAEDQGVSQRTLYTALHELEARRLIEATKLASRVPPRPTMYALAWEPKDDTDHSDATVKASNEFKKFR